MVKKYINSNNLPPSMHLGFTWLLALTTYVLNWPTWVYGVAGTISVLMAIYYIKRSMDEEGVDVVHRGKD